MAAKKKASPSKAKAKPVKTLEQTYLSVAEMLGNRTPYASGKAPTRRSRQDRLGFGKNAHDRKLDRAIDRFPFKNALVPRDNKKKK
jgi:hypothetical protein